MTFISDKTASLLIVELNVQDTITSLLKDLSKINLIIIVDSVVRIIILAQQTADFIRLLKPTFNCSVLSLVIGGFKHVLFLCTKVKLLLEKIG